VEPAGVLKQTETMMLSLLVYLFSALSLRWVISYVKRTDHVSYHRAVEDARPIIDFDRLANLCCLLPVVNTGLLLIGIYETLKPKSNA
jgi:hypothetical protein